jgi:hypothetical protein
MRAKDLEEAAGVGRITKQNQTVDVGPNELKKQAAKFGNTVDKDGRPPTLSKKVKGSKTNVLFNLGMAEDKEKRYTAMEWALMEGGHSVDDLDKPTPSVKELADMHNVSTGHILKQLEMGIEAEYEHTSDFKIAKEIALDHIAEDPNYYDHLKFIERALKSKSYRKGYKAAKLSGRRKTRKLHTKFSDDINEAYKLQLERDYDMYILHIKDTKTGKRTEVRGKKGYESGNYDPDDKLHQLLDTVGKSANIAELINGEVVTINPKHPDADRAKSATDKAYNENFADGKKKGKSRPGRVKRAGASCNGSVTSLRKRAKNSSGEKARMYHWCANMKSGRKKK